MKNVIEQLNRIEEIIKTRDTSHEEFVRLMLKSSPERGFLVNKATEYFSKEMFMHLYKLGVFDFTSIPSKTEQGYYGWDSSFLLRKASEVSLKNFDEDINNILLHVIDDYIDYVFSQKGNTNRNFRPDWFFSDAILALRLNEITDKHFKFLREMAMHSAMTHIDSDLTEKFFIRVTDAKDERIFYWLLDTLYSVSQNQIEDKFSLKPLVDSFVLRQFSERSSELMLKAFGSAVIDWFIQRIKKLNVEFPVAFSKILIVAIADDEQNWRQDTLSHIIARQLRELLDCLIIDPVYQENIVRELKHQKHGILRRIAIYIIDKHFATLQNLFWEIDNPLLDYECKLEVYKLIEHHILEFSPEQIQKLLDDIQGLEIEKSDDYTKEEILRYTDSRKIEWLQAFEKSKEPLRTKINQEIENLKSKGGIESSFPGYDSYSRFTTGGDYDHYRIFSQPIETVVERLNNPVQWNGYDQYGLQQDLRNLVIEKSDEITAKLEMFKNIPSGFLYFIFDAFRELLSRGTSIDRRKILEVTKIILTTREEIWNSDDSNNENGSMIGMICWMLRDAAEREVFMISELEKGAEILIIIDQRFTKPFHYLNQNKDKNFDIINSTRGKLYDAMVKLSLKIAKPKSEQSTERWYSPIRDVFSKRLQDGSFFDEFYWTLGMFTPHINYLDGTWWKEKREQIFINTDKIQDYAFKAYLLYTRSLYADLFENLKEYYYRLLHSHDEKIYCDRIVEHAVIAVVYNMNGAAELLNAILDSKKVEYLAHLVDFLDKRNLPQLNDAMMINFWQKILDATKEIDATKVVYATTEFIETIQEFSPQVVILFETAVANYSVSPRIYRIIERIIDQFETQPKEAGQMLEALLLKIKDDFSFQKEKTIEALQMLYNTDQKDRANRIALHLAEYGNFYVRDVYNNANGKQF